MSLPDDSDCAHEDCSESFEGNYVSNIWEHISATKFCFTKVVRTARLKKMRRPIAQHLYFSLFSIESKLHFEELEKKQKRTYVGDALNPFLDKALYAAENITTGGLICLYIGDRQSVKECHARQKKGRPSAYALNIGQGVVIDALGFPFGAAMANHSCEPNSRLRTGWLRGEDKPPYGYLQSLKDIQIGSVIECDYNYLRDISDEQLTIIKRSGNYLPCRCLKPSCKVVFVASEDLRKMKLTALYRKNLGSCLPRS